MIELEKLAFFLIFLISAFCLFTSLVLSLYMGMLMKRYDSSGYENLYILYITVSPALFISYVFNSHVPEMYPKNRRWLFSVLRVSISTAGICFVLVLIGAWLFS